MPQVTVIIPAYNAEAYIERCVRSILAQTHRALRLLVVDDGSTDRTGAILDALAAEDGRLEALHVENGGPAAARNRALDTLGPETDYILFSDADDEMPPDAIEYALREGAGADLVLMGFSIVQPDGSRSDYSEPFERLGPDTMDAALGRLYKANLLNQVWAKLFAADLVRDLRFPDYRWGEDRLFLFDVLERLQRLKVLPGCRHIYVMHEGESLITRYYEKKFDVCCEIDRRMEALCRELGVREDADFRYMFAKSVFSCMTTLYARSCRLSRAEKLAVTARIGSDERVHLRCRDAAGGLPTRALCAVLRSGKPGLTLACFRGVAWAGEHWPGLFTRLKHRK